MILCCGEALIDMVPSTSVEDEACFAPKVGGAVFNTAIALGRLGGDVGLFTGVSDDLFGRMLGAELKASRVVTDHLVTRQLPSSLAFVELNSGQASYTFYTHNAADTSLTLADVPTDMTGLEALFFGGISLCTDPTAASLHAFMRAQTDSCITMIDPNIRPAFIDDESAYRARLHDMIGISDIMKVSSEDLDWLVPEMGTIADKLAKLVHDDKLVFVTKGSDGADAYLGSQKIADAKSRPVQVVDTIGAGDTFNAAILHSLQQDGVLRKSTNFKAQTESVQKALDFAVYSAAINVSRKGANPPWDHELDF